MQHVIFFSSNLYIYAVNVCDILCHVDKWINTKSNVDNLHAYLAPLKPTWPLEGISATQ